MSLSKINWSKSCSTLFVSCAGLENTSRPFSLGPNYSSHYLNTSIFLSSMITRTWNCSIEHDNLENYTFPYKTAAWSSLKVRFFYKANMFFSIFTCFRYMTVNSQGHQTTQLLRLHLYCLRPSCQSFSLNKVGIKDYLFTCVITVNYVVTNNLLIMRLVSQ